MAVDAYAIFFPYPAGTAALKLSESQADWSGVDSASQKSGLNSDFSSATPMKTTDGKIDDYGQIFELEDYSFDIEQTLNIGSQGGGAGAGKVTFNPFSITRKIDALSPTIYKMACSGTPFARVALALRKGSGGDVSGQIFVRFDFKLVAVKTISWAHDDESPKETVTLEYGALIVNYAAQNPNGTFKPVAAGGWNRVKNTSDTSTTTLI